MSLPFHTRLVIRIVFGNVEAAESMSSDRNIVRLRKKGHANILDGTDNLTVPGSRG